VEDDFVVQRPAVHRVRMAHHSGVAGTARSSIQQCFQASNSAVER
jgi:hypothetical protein